MTGSAQARASAIRQAAGPVANQAPSQQAWQTGNCGGRSVNRPGGMLGGDQVFNNTVVQAELSFVRVVTPAHLSSASRSKLQAQARRAPPLHHERQHQVRAGHNVSPSTCRRRDGRQQEAQPYFLFTVFVLIALRQLKSSRQAACLHSSPSLRIIAASLAVQSL